MAHEIQDKTFVKADASEKHVVIPDGITAIAEEAFMDNLMVESVEIPDSVKKIGPRCFKDAKHLKSVRLPGKIKSLPDMAFSGCVELSGVVLPASLEKIYARAFVFCEKLTEITFPDKLKFIGASAFGNCGFKKIVLPDSLETFANCSFSDCKELTEVTIPKSITIIRDLAFFQCDKLRKVVIPDSVTTICPSAFSDCKALETITLPDSVTTIGNGAFAHCESMKHFVIPDGVTVIDSFTFSNCVLLEDITIPDSVEVIKQYAFGQGCKNLKQISVPEKCKIRKDALADSVQVIRRKTEGSENKASSANKTGSKSKKPAVTSGKSASSGAKGSTYHYNDQVSFELPKGYTHRTAEDNNGNTREEICYGKSVNDDGDETWEFTASILPGTFDTLEGYTREKNEKILDFYKRGLENSRFSKDATAPGTAVYAIRRPIRIFGRLLKFKVDGIAAVIDEDQLLCLQVAFQQDEADPAPEIRAFEHLMTVGNSIRVNGKAMDFSKPDPKKLVKELQFSYDEENDESSLNLGIDIRVKNGDGEETNAGTISISGKSEEGKKKVAAKKTDKKRAFVPIEQEGNRLIFGGCWSMELVSNCRLCLEPTEEETGGKRYIIKCGTRDLWQFSIADVKDKQIIQSAASEISQGVIEKLHDAQGLIDFELRSDDSLKIHLHASLAADGFSCAMVKVETPDGDTYALTSMLPEIDDIGEAMQKINDEELDIYHPFGAGWEAQWTLLMRMVSTIRSLDDPEPDDENWVIGGYEYALNPETEIIPGVRCRIPKSAIKISEHTYALTELGLDQSQQVTAQNILTLSFVHSEREDPFDRQTSEPHNRLMVTHLGKGFGSILREKRTEGFHACLGYIPINGGKYIIALIKDQLIAQIVIECGEQENHPIQYEAMQCAEKLFNSLSCGNMPEEAPYVFPPTLDFLHEHYDLVESGGYTTHRDADFTGQPIRMLLEKHDNEGEEAYGLMKTSGEYHLDRDAVSLAKVFRLDSTLFDVYGDTEALIRKGMFKDARCFEALRSLAWTVSCMADRSGRPIGDYSFEELEKIGELIKEQNYLNYAAFSYMPGLCDHYDWHVFYVPDEYIRSDYQSSTDLRYLTGKENRGGNSITIFGFGGLDSFGGMNRNSEIISRNEETLESLEALRLDLQTLLPVMETIHDGLLADRDRSEQLEGPLADALIAWCALAIAAREPFYSEEAADTYEADAGLDEPLERPTDSLDDKPIGKAKPAVKKAAKSQTKPAAKPAKPSGEVLDLGGETVIKPGQFGGNMTLKNIVIPEGVTEIGEMAFYTCLGLQSVVFPKSLKKIGKMAFMSCRALQKVELQEGVEEIETHAFGATNNLKEVHLPDSLKKVDRCVFGLGGDSPYATAYLSGKLAKQQYDINGDQFNDIYARHLIIDGKPYDSVKEYLYKELDIQANGYYPPYDPEAEARRQEKKKKQYREDMEKACREGKPLQDMIEASRKAINANQYADKEAFEQAVRNLDRNAVVTFAGKHFALTGFGYYEEDVTAEIEKRGGTVHSSMVKAADYLVVCLEEPGASKVKKALEWRQKGVTNKIVSDYQMWQAIYGKNGSVSSGVRAIPAARASSSSPAPAQQPTKEEAEALQQAQQIVGKMTEDLDSTKSALEKHQEELKRQEEEREKKKAEAKARGKSSSDEADMLAVLLIEEDLGCLNRDDEDFASTYAEDFGAYTEKQLITLRKKVLPKLHDKAALEEAKEDMLSRPVKDRFGISTGNWFNVCNEWDFKVKGERAIEKTRLWYREEELDEVRRLMEEHKQAGIDSVNRQLSNFNPAWNSWAGVKNDLHINIEEGSDPIPEKHQVFDVRIDPNHHVQILLKHPSMGFVTIPAMNLFASVWKVKPADIWDAALNNSMDDSRGVSAYQTKTDAAKAKAKALAALQADAPKAAPASGPAKAQPAPAASSQAAAAPAQSSYKEKRRAELEEKLRSLKQELSRVSGLLGFMKRNKLNKEIQEVETELRQLTNN